MFKQLKLLWTNIIYEQTIFFERILAWEPSVAQGTHRYSRRLPALRRFYKETNFKLQKSTH